MNPIYWFVLYVLLSFLCTAIAVKRGRSGGRYLATLLIAPLPLTLLASWGLADMPGKGTWVALVAFTCPLLGIFLAIFSQNAQQVAVTKGEYGAYKKCPFCAESVRKEAVKCRHCQSDLTIAAK